MRMNSVFCLVPPGCGTVLAQDTVSSQHEAANRSAQWISLVLIYFSEAPGNFPSR